MTGGTITGSTIVGSTVIGTTLKNTSGTFSVSPDGVIKGATIDAQTFKKSGFEITALKVENYTLRHNTPLPVPEGFKFEDCRYVVLNIQQWVEVKYKGRRGHYWDHNIEGGPINPNEKDILMAGAQHGTKRIGNTEIKLGTSRQFDAV